MPLLPDWAPNVHPLLVHFPIAWLVAAIMVDLFALALALPRRPWDRVDAALSPAAAVFGEGTASWAEATATFLYAAGALSTVTAYLSGLQAAATVFTPGSAHATVGNHESWALATTLFFGLLTLVRIALVLFDRRPAFPGRAALTLAGLAGLILLFFTGDRGARLVYEFGVGVGRAWLPPGAVP